MQMLYSPKSDQGFCGALRSSGALCKRIEKAFVHHQKTVLKSRQFCSPDLRDQPLGCSAEPHRCAAAAAV